MAPVTTRRSTAAPAAEAGQRAAAGFRPSSRSRARIAIGALLAVVAVGAMLLIFAAADKRVAVLQLVHDVPAGQQITAADVRTIEVSADPTLAVVHASDVAVVAGRYARVRMVSGSLLTNAMLQTAPLVGKGSAVVAITIPTGELPAGLRERSQVQLVFPPTKSGSTDAAAPTPVTGRIIGLPTEPDAVSGRLSLSVEVLSADAVTVAQATTVRVVLLDPGVDPASAGSAAPSEAATSTVAG